MKIKKTFLKVTVPESTSNKKTPTKLIGRGFNKLRQRHTLPHVTAVPSALVSLTSLFGMGRGGPHRNSHLKALDQPYG